MVWWQFLIEVAALLACGSYLYAKHRQRWRNWVPQDNPAKWTGHGLETAKLKPRLQHVRQDYVAAQQATRSGRFPSDLLALARRAVTRLDFFQHREPEEPAHPQGA